MIASLKLVSFGLSLTSMQKLVCRRIFKYWEFPVAIPITISLETYNEDRPPLLTGYFGGAMAVELANGTPFIFLRQFLL
jgi:hypothetical protein